jgi:ribonuclease BN (tRNA processing enzyme)
MSLTFIPLGVGDAFSALYYSSCLLLEAEGERLLLDCPHPIQKMLREAGLSAGVALPASSLDAVVLTHLHADHAAGLEGLAYYSRFVLERRLKVLVHPEVGARLWEGHLAAGMEQLLSTPEASPRAMRLEDYLDITLLREDGEVTCGAFRVACRRTIHHIPTTALRISAGGRSLASSADTAFDLSLIHWLAEADLVVHETNHGVHTPYERLAALPAPLRERMRLIHYPDAFDTGASLIEPLVQGRRYTV